MTEDISLTDIVDIKHWQKIQDHFGQVVRVTIRTVDKAGNCVTRPSNPTRMCEETLANSSVAIARCKRCLPASLSDLMHEEKWKEGYQCHLGLNIFCIPVVAFENEAIVYILVGPVFLGQRRKPQAYTQKAEELGIDLDMLIDALIEVKLFTFAGIKSVIELINEIACNLAKFGYNRYILEKGPLLPKLDKKLHRFYMDKILGALLEVSAHTAGTEFGSIMLLDEKTDELYIKVARGLKDDVIENTRLKIGEGIAGLAIKERRFLNLNDSIIDERFKSRLKRPEIKSSVVAPLLVKNQPIGVMNIGTSRTTDGISPESIETLHRLIELTETALADLLKI